MSVDVSGAQELYRLRELGVVSMTDVALIREVSETIAKIDGEQFEVSDRLYHLTGEVFERWAPAVLVKATELDYVHDSARDAELAGFHEAMERRARLRAPFLEANRQASEVD
jgi:hypothetical protein